MPIQSSRYLPPVRDGATQTRLGMLRQNSQRLFEKARHDFVIGTGNKHVFGAGQINAAVDRKRHPSILLVAVKLNGGMPAGKALDYFDAVVGGTIVNDNDFGWLCGLF